MKDICRFILESTWRQNLVSIPTVNTEGFQICEEVA